MFHVVDLVIHGAFQLSVVLGTSLHCRGTPTIAHVLAETALVISAFICVHLRFTKTPVRSGCGCAALCSFVVCNGVPSFYNRR